MSLSNEVFVYREGLEKLMLMGAEMVESRNL